MQVREQQLPREPVVVAHARAGDREAQHAVQQDRVLDVAGEAEALALELDGAPRTPLRSQRSSSSEYIQYGIRRRIMNGSNGRSPWLWARSWMRSHSANVCSDSVLGRDERGGVGRQLERRIRAAARDRAAEALRLAVAEDRAEVMRRRARDRDRLGEQRRALAVVAGACCRRA